jgi:exopolysaccharide biosynthesis WecB/TagA/CpsF family protein
LSPPRYPILGVAVTAVERHEAAAAILDSARRRQPLGISALAVHGIMEAVFDPELQYRLNNLEMIVADGQPVRWALRWVHDVHLQERVCGPDLMNDVCAMAAKEGLSIYLYGSTESTLAQLEAQLGTLHPGLRIAGMQPSRFRQATAEEQAEDTARILQSGAAIVFAGLGCPRQEIWTYEIRNRVSLPVVAVGAAFDFHAGNAKRAPQWMQRRGLEWLFRLLQEPRRLWRRYVLLNPAYLALIALEKARIRRISPARAREPRELVRPG